MRKKTTRLGWGALFAMILTAGSAAGQYKVVGEKGDLYFGHISYVDAGEGAAVPVVFRLGAKVPENAVLNFPLGPGDMIQTPDGARCEVQFDNGTVVRLDAGTRLKIETILAQALSTVHKVSNLLLAQGQVYVMYRKHHSQEIFQVIMPAASVKFNDNSVALIELRDGRSSVQVERGRVELLYGPDERDLEQKKVPAGERFAVGAESSAQPAGYAAVSPFKSWNEKVNADFASLHQGNVLPQPLQKLPPAVFEFAQKFGNLHGEWLWHDLYGYVWRPHLNDQRYPWGSWQPYFYGNWSDYNGQLFWVPGEPWGWVPYHLGLWMWDQKSGWVWMPGSMFAPAWVDWEFLFGHYFWRPFTLFDYFDGLDDPYLWGGDYWNLALGWPPGTGADQPPATRPVRSVVTKDGLKKKSQPSLPVPKEMKNALKAAGQALKQGDPGVRASWRETMRRSVVISKDDFAKPGWREKTVSLDRFLERPEVMERGSRPVARVPSELVAKDALRSVEAIRTVHEVNAQVGAELMKPVAATTAGDPRAGGGQRPDAVIQDRGGLDSRPAPAAEKPGRISTGEKSESPGPGQPALRFRDWNPDVRAAVRMGVDINYSSRTNEVYSSRLGLRSRDVISRGRPSPAFREASSGIDSDPSSGIGAETASSGSGQAGSSPASATSSSPGKKGSSKESGGEKKQD